MMKKPPWRDIRTLDNSKETQKSFLIGFLIVSLLLLTCCSFLNTNQATPQKFKDPGIGYTATPPAEVINEASATPAAEIPVQENQPIEISDPTYIRQGAMYSYLDPYQLNDIATGPYNSDYPSCGEEWIATLPQESAPTLLTLEYMTPVLPEMISIYTGTADPGIRRIEVMNSQSGLALQLDLQVGSEPTLGACTTINTIPLNSEFEVDQVIIEFEDGTAASRIAAVELSGWLQAYTEPSVYWRVPLPDTPVDIAVDAYGLIYVATEDNGLFTYDVEGNRINEIPIPEGVEVFSLAVDRFQNPVVTDRNTKGYIVLNPDGVILTSGGNEFYTKAAINPQDNNVYLLFENRIDAFSTYPAEELTSLEIDETGVYSNLAFDPSGWLYVVRDFDWNANLMLVDPLTGVEMDTYPLILSSMAETVAKDLAVDQMGNSYILFSMNTAQIAVHQLSQAGLLLQRFGRLTGDMNDWPEGTFLDPKAIAVSPDGRFIIIADGYDDQAYLTTYLMEIDES